MAHIWVTQPERRHGLFAHRHARDPRPARSIVVTLARKFSWWKPNKIPILTALAYRSEAMLSARTVFALSAGTEVASAYHVWRQPVYIVTRRNGIRAAQITSGIAEEARARRTVDGATLAHARVICGTQLV